MADDFKALDAVLQKKSVKSVVMHLEKKVSPDIPGSANLFNWIAEMNRLLDEDGYDKTKYLEMRKKLNEAIGWITDVYVRNRLRNSWMSFGKAMEKKVSRHPNEDL